MIMLKIHEFLCFCHVADLIHCGCRLYTWQVALPYLLSQQLFSHTPALSHIQDSLAKLSQPSSESPSPPTSPTRSVSSPTAVSSTSARVTSPVPVEKLSISPPPAGVQLPPPTKRSSWRSWVPFLGERVTGLIYPIMF